MDELQGIKFEVEVINGMKVVKITSDEVFGIDSDKVCTFWGNIDKIWGGVDEVYGSVGRVWKNVDTVDGDVRKACGVVNMRFK
jgi:hypothetical protein